MSQPLPHQRPTEGAKLVPNRAAFGETRRRMPNAAPFHVNHRLQRLSLPHQRVKRAGLSGIDLEAPNVGARLAQFTPGPLGHRTW